MQKLTGPFGLNQKIKFIEQNGTKRVESYYNGTFTDVYALEDYERLVSGEVVDLRTDPAYIAQKLAEAQSVKHDENTLKLHEARYGKTFTVILQGSECIFDTTDETQRDLLTAAAVTATGATYDNWVTNNGMLLDLTAEDVQTVFAMFFTHVSPLYTLDLQYKTAIDACTTAEEVAAIELNY